MMPTSYWFSDSLSQPLLRNTYSLASIRTRERLTEKDNSDSANQEEDTVEELSARFGNIL